MHARTWTFLLHHFTNGSKIKPFQPHIAFTTGDDIGFLRISQVVHPSLYAFKQDSWRSTIWKIYHKTNLPHIVVTLGNIRCNNLLYIYISNAGCLFEILNQFPRFPFLLFFLAHKELFDISKFHAESKIFNWKLIRHTCWANSQVGLRIRTCETAFFDVVLSSFCKICISEHQMLESYL